MYVRLTDNDGKTWLIGMSAASGKIVSQVVESTAEIYFTTEVDDVTGNIISVAQNFTGSNDYYLAKMDATTGDGTPLGPFTFANKNFYPTVSAIAPANRSAIIICSISIVSSS